MNKVDDRVSGHYGWPGLVDAIENEIRRNGIKPEDVTVAQLAPVDNHHAFPLAGTVALATAAGISAADCVLDVGGGTAAQRASSLIASGSAWQSST